MPSLDRQKILLLQAALGKGDAARGAWETWVGETDFEKLDDYSFLLLGLLYVNVGSLIAEHPLKGRLRGIHRQTWAHTQFMLQHSRPVLDALTESGCQWCALSGLALVEDYYPDAGTRRLDSVGIGVTPDHQQKAVKVLQKLNWQQMEQGRSQNQWQNAQGGRLDIQEKLMLPPDIFLRHLSGAKLSPTALLWQVCVEGVSWRNYPRLVWITDGVMILRRSSDQIDWTQLEDWACQYHLTLRLAAAVEHIRPYTPIDLPIFDTKAASPIERLEFALIAERRSENIFARLLRLGIRSWREKNFAVKGQPHGG